MATSELKLIKHTLEYVPKEKISLVPNGTRGIYALYQKAADQDIYDLVYIGMARGLNLGIRKRLRSHRKSLRASFGPTIGPHHGGPVSAFHRSTIQ